ncbi:hypothetical protein [Synechococcus sp. CBW1107]|uniref:hypothetical protein n=1 Tax=Synechococcus sp. CBW1107 TaxID=2789857 RepID=UPI002AD25A47|nr:hypothetical protein [Synechococcus sp. CBW1107]CAK6701943.1 hypothetical protein IFHNHDMJ_03287 [Synechococcus sp. CBW1107]
MPLALLLAAMPLTATPAPPRNDFVPFTTPAPYGSSPVLGVFEPVETFDPIARALVMAQQMPRDWVGSYQPFGGAPVSVDLRLASTTAIGQMVDLRGQITVGSVTWPVQGNLNAKSDQIDLLLLCSKCDVAGLEAGGEFQGLQGLQLSGWNAPRLTGMGGRLELQPAVNNVSMPAAPAAVRTRIRGLW